MNAPPPYQPKDDSRIEIPETLCVEPTETRKKRRDVLILTTIVVVAAMVLSAVYQLKNLPLLFFLGPLPLYQLNQTLYG